MFAYEVLRQRISVQGRGLKQHLTFMSKGPQLVRPFSVHVQGWIAN